MNRGQNAGRGDSGRSPTFVRTPELGDVEQSECNPVDWSIHQGGGAL